MTQIEEVLNSLKDQQVMLKSAARFGHVPTPMALYDLCETVAKLTKVVEGLIQKEAEA